MLCHKVSITGHVCWYPLWIPHGRTEPMITVSALALTSSPLSRYRRYRTWLLHWSPQWRNPGPLVKFPLRQPGSTHYPVAVYQSEPLPGFETIADLHRQQISSYHMRPLASEVVPLLLTFFLYVVVWFWSKCSTDFKVHLYCKCLYQSLGVLLHIFWTVHRTATSAPSSLILPTKSKTFSVQLLKQYGTKAPPGLQ